MIFVSAPQRMVKVVQYQLKARKITTGVALCVPAGAEQARKTCS